VPPSCLWRNSTLFIYIN